MTDKVRFRGTDIPFLTLDVFTEDPFAGNQLAVFPRAEGLDAPMMQTIAAEMNLSETVFITGADSQTPALRIFTPKVELPFAGHPTVGAAVALANMGSAKPERIAMSTKLGVVNAQICRHASGPVEAWIEAPALPREISRPETAEAAAVIGVKEDELGDTSAVWSAGVPMTFIPVANREVLNRASTQIDVWNAHFRDSSAHQLYAFTLDDWQTGEEIHARVFAPGLGIPEDPATGAGAVALVGFLQRLQQCHDGGRRWIVHQGLQIGRPSKLLLDAEFANGEVVSIKLGGCAVPIIHGALQVPVSVRSGGGN
ncbi:PhzF family phenazine biosynthesis protein [Mesorhizobium sp. 1B3]|uniref:PhzF family phenazine biosynthesis protein n=1 Tax=Mesorhizobium sp. 1B3 TaxID=3243599 RepID=UPI003D95CDC6